VFPPLFLLAAALVATPVFAIPSARPAPSSQKALQGLGREEIHKMLFKTTPPGVPDGAVARLVIEGKKLGNVRLKRGASGGVEIAADPLQKNLRGLAREEICAALEREITKDKTIALEALRAQGLEVTNDPTRLLVEIKVPSMLRARRAHGAAESQMEDPWLSGARLPAPWSFFLNMGGKASLRRFEGGLRTEEADKTAAADLEGALRVHGLVLEGAGLCAFDSENTFARQDIRLVYDTPQKALRVTAGDLRYPAGGWQSVLPMGGVGISKDWSLTPHVQAYPAGDFSFHLERPAEVKIWVNNSLARTMDLEPGTHDFSGISPVSRENDVRVEIEDVSGQRRTLTYSFLYEPELLAKGLAQYSLCAGFLRTLENESYRYHRDKPAASFFYRRGITDALSLSGHAQFLESAALLGAGGTWAAPAGTLDFESGWSASGGDTMGFACKAGFSHTCLSGGGRPWLQWRAEAEYRSPSFGPPDTETPMEHNRLRATGSAGLFLPWSLNFRTGGSVILLRDLEEDFAWSAFASLDRRWGKHLGTTLDFRMSKDQGGEEEARVQLGVTWWFDKGNHHLAAAREPDGDFTANWSYGQGGGVNRGDVSAAIRAGEDTREASVRAGWRANQGEAGLEVSRRETESGGEWPAENRVSATVRTAVVAADGAVALSRPVKDSFVIVRGEKGLRNTALGIGGSEEGGYRARSNMLGPAVETGLSAHRVAKVEVHPVNPPMGAVPENLSHELLPGYKSGFCLSLGEETRRVALGRLVESAGKPVTHCVVEITGPDEEDKEPVTTFTSQTGRFQVAVKKPGAYTVRALDKGRALAGGFRVEEGAGDVVDLGKVSVEAGKGKDGRR
jgi:outer membrane usher protein